MKNSANSFLHFYKNSQANSFARNNYLGPNFQLL